MKFKRILTAAMAAVISLSSLAVTANAQAAANNTAAVDVSVKNAAKLAQPKAMATKTANSITVKWNKISGAEEYKLGYSTDNKKWSFKTTKKTTLTVSGLKSGTVYYYRVGAMINGKVRSDWSTTKTVKTIVKVPAAPKNIKATSTSSSFKITWSKVSGADKYKVRYSTDNKHWTYKTVKESCTVTGLKANKKYYYSVCCVKSGKDGAWSKTASVTTKQNIVCYKGTNIPDLGKFANAKVVEKESADGLYGYLYNASDVTKTEMNNYKKELVKKGFVKGQDLDEDGVEASIYVSNKYYVGVGYEVYNGKKYAVIVFMDLAKI